MLRILYLLVACAAFAQTPQATVEGRVVNAVTGEPVKKAQVMLRRVGASDSIYTATCDPSGGFSIPGLDAGQYSVMAERGGFVNVTSSGMRAMRRGATVTVAAGQHVTGVTVKLTPQAVITGRVVDEDGDPVTGASVALFRYAWQRGQRRLMPTGGVNTDDQGEYRLYNLQPGKYYVSASSRPVGLSASTISIHAVRTELSYDYAATFYPNTVDPAAAAQLIATPGAVLRGIDITLAKARTYTVSGKVTDPGGTPARTGTMVFALSRDNSGAAIGVGNQRSGSVGPDGTFHMAGLRSGSYTIAVERWEDSKRLSARVPVEVSNGNVEGLLVALTPAVALTGSFKVEGGAEVALGGFQVLLMPKQDGSPMGAAGGRSNDDGTVRIYNAAPDLYNVNVMSLPPNCYVKSIRLGETDVLARGLDLMPGAAGQLEILISQTAGSADGNVLDAKQQPAAGAVVVAVPDGERAAFDMFYRTTMADSSGHFTITGIAPGDYHLYAFEDVEAGAWQDPEFRKQYEKQSEAVTIKENGRESKQLVAIAAGDGG